MLKYQTIVMTQLTRLWRISLSLQTENGDFAENCSLSKVNVVSEAREVDDFYPRAQLHKLLEDCGKPELAREKAVSDDGGYKVIQMDRNNAMEKVLAGLESLVEQYVEADLKEEVYEDAKRQVKLKLKVEMRRQQKSQEDMYVKSMRLKSGIVKGSSKATNPANKCAKKLFGIRLS